jgi:cytochrome c
MRERVRWRGAVLLPVGVVLLLLAAGCGDRPLPSNLLQVSGGDPGRGRADIVKYGCGACHQINGISGADGVVGPPLSGIGSRGTIAGVLANNPQNMVNWIQNPQAIVPGNAMPDMGVTQQDALDIAAYLYTLK